MRMLISPFQSQRWEVTQRLGGGSRERSASPGAGEQIEPRWQSQTASVHTTVHASVHSSVHPSVDGRKAWRAGSGSLRRQSRLQDQRVHVEGARHSDLVCWIVLFVCLFVYLYLKRQMLFNFPKWLFLSIFSWIRNGPLEKMLFGLFCWFVGLLVCCKQT